MESALSRGNSVGPNPSGDTSNRIRENAVKLNMGLLPVLEYCVNNNLFGTFNRNELRNLSQLILNNNGNILVYFERMNSNRYSRLRNCLEKLQNSQL